MTSQPKGGSGRPLRVGVIGVGIMGANHARVFAGLPDVQLVAVADPVQAQRDLVTRVLGTPAVETADELLGLDIDAVWLSPIYPSPGRDVGYDVSDHSSVDPLLGTEADFDELVARAHDLGLRVILDLVMNHTSDEHPWFQASRRRQAPAPRRAPRDPAARSPRACG